MKLSISLGVSLAVRMSQSLLDTETLLEEVDDDVFEVAGHQNVSFMSNHPS